jgi:hypothetical protein
MSDGLSVISVSKKPPLHWPGKIWVALSFIGAAGFIVLTIVEIIQGIEGDPDVIWLDIFKAYWLRWFNILVLIASGVTMLVKRKIGWFFALVTLSTGLVFRSVSWIWRLSKGGVEAETTGQLVLLLIVVVLTFGIPIAWLVYFIKARRRYDIGRLAEN